jgi:granule-bound starch synthase
MDLSDWNPAVDKFLDVRYDAATVAEGKAAAKEALQAELGLEASANPTKPIPVMWKAIFGKKHHACSPF